MQDKSSASHGKITIRYVGLTSSRCIFICPNIMRAVPKVVDIFSTTGFYEVWKNVSRYTIVTFLNLLKLIILLHYVIKSLILSDAPISCLKT